MRIYKITKGQLAIILAFGILINFLFFIDEKFILFLFILGLLIFYTIGWQNYNKNNKSNNLKKIKKTDSKVIHAGI